MTDPFSERYVRGIWCPHSENLPPVFSTEFETANFRDNNWSLEYAWNGKGRLMRRSKNWPSFDIKKPLIQLLFLFVAFLYGGLHCFAWNSTFPSHVQQLLWRISSLMIMAAGVPLLLCYFLLEEVHFNYTIHNLDPRCPPGGGFGLATKMARVLYMHKCRKNHSWSTRAGWYRFGNNLLRGMMTLILFGYVFARAYLIIECFIELVHLPPGRIFLQPSWSTYFPHLG
jgi:hypothetical protein